jgi:hypothetical protein
VARCSFGADEVSGDDGFAVAGFECMQTAEADGDEGRGEEEPWVEILGLNELSKFAARGLLLIGLEVNGGGCWR